MNIIKKDGTLEKFKADKIKTAVKKAAFRCDRCIDDDKLSAMAETVKNRLKEENTSVLQIHELVIATLSSFGFKDVADSYAEYRYYKTRYARTFEKLRQDADDVLRLGDRENANFDSSLVSTKGSLIKGYLTKSLYKQFYLSRREKELTERGDIYIHDMRDMILGSYNCMLFDMATLLKGGFEMSNVKYTEPKTVLSALQVIGDVTLVASAQQFGGFTIGEIDKVLLPYAHKTFKKFHDEMIEEGLSEEAANKYAYKALKRELEQGFQSLELKLNTVPSSRGDFAFTTITFGQWKIDLPETDKKIMKMIGEAILFTRKNGHGVNHQPVVFPKLVYLYDQKQVDGDHCSSELFDDAVRCSSLCMYPDYLSLSSAHGTVSRIFKEQGVVTSPMGCRAYLSPWKNKEGRYITNGRCNIGAVSLNIPLLIKLAKLEYPKSWKEAFWEILDDRLQLIREFLKKRYDVIRHQSASSNPLSYTQGGLYGGYRKPDEKVGDLVNSMTASFGITALDESTYLWTGKRMVEEGGHFAVEILKHLNERVGQFKKEDGYLYALYGTPAESLCGTQAKQYAAFCKERGVENEFAHSEHYDPEYFSNSFHINVTEEITPLEKQSKELEAFHLCEGGHIQYVRLDNPNNFEANKAIIQRGMKMGFYQGVNFDSAYCQDCGQHSTNIGNTCPHCGSRNISVISRVCGYLGYSNVNGSTRMNDAKMKEISRRKSM
ncbi:anaerobic ribonucleoside-triphosphate reductase [Sutterella wadsworthensis]|uniref:anaerobic ribonucleoside-triphosphate reductase n=1 Tax=Sutterella wadsworthensis TaxID=40545 RepID=UPI00241C58C0|nr:anaerobic ribonucleoside-triphosphate reductase [Sutterella wadsworthensis]